MHLTKCTTLMSGVEYMYMLQCLYICTCVSVCVQIWMVVQRKWMYLESIFLAGDIRAQLPEEAKKFDNIDKLFKKVSAVTPMYMYVEMGTSSKWHPVHYV